MNKIFAMSNFYFSDTNLLSLHLSSFFSWSRPIFVKKTTTVQDSLYILYSDNF